MNAEFFAAIEQLEKEKGIPKQYMLEKITQALNTAYKRDNPNAGDNVTIEFNEKRKDLKMIAHLEVVETVENPQTQISLEKAREKSAKYDIGDMVKVPVATKEFGRIAAQTAKQVIIQGIREAERGIFFQEFTSKEHEILSAVVSRVDTRNGALVLEIGAEKSEVVLMPGEQVKTETYKEGDHLKVYVVEVRKATKGPQVLISRSHTGLVKRLFELEVPEIHDGLIEIMSIAREPGSRTKIAVYSHDENIDPIGACIGPRGGRVSNIVDELRGEKIDIIKYSEEADKYIAAALSPSDVISVELLPEGKSCRVIVPNDQLSLAIGKEGQNARLAAKLTGYKIDIKPLNSIE